MFRESDIRPDQLKKGIEEASHRDLQRLLLGRDSFVQVPCPACGSKRFLKRFEKNSIDYVECLECETLYISPRPTPEMLERFYATSENYAYWSKHVFPASEEARRQKIFRPRAERVADICRRYDIPTDTLLDVGAGFGTFCEEIQRIRLFRKVIAVEPAPDLAETCRRKGLAVIEKPIEKVCLEEEAVDVVVSFEVIEHLFAPRVFVQNCASALKPGGLFVITCPNVKGFDLVVLQSLSDTVDAEHLNYFHPASFSHLLDQHGFEVLEALTPGQLDAELVRKKALEGAFDLSSQPFLRQVLIDEWARVGDAFQQFLAANGLSSHMWLVARRRH